MNIEPPKPFVEKRPWGEELWITQNAPSMIKILTVFPGECFSLQFHNNRDEYWRILSGNGVAIIGGNKTDLTTGQDCFVPRKTHHRLYGGTEKLVVLELAFGDFNEADIVHLEDKYGRV